MTDTTRPVPPSITAVLYAGAQISWKGASDNTGIDHYKVFDGTTFIKQVARTTRTCKVAPLSPGQHSVRVVPYDAAGNYANSKPIEFTVTVA